MLKNIPNITTGMDNKKNLICFSCFLQWPWSSWSPWALLLFSRWLHSPAPQLPTSAFRLTGSGRWRRLLWWRQNGGRRSKYVRMSPLISAHNVLLLLSTKRASFKNPFVLVLLLNPPVNFSPFLFLYRRAGIFPASLSGGRRDFHHILFSSHNATIPRCSYTGSEHPPKWSVPRGRGDGQRDRCMRDC